MTPGAHDWEACPWPAEKRGAPFLMGRRCRRCGAVVLLTGEPGSPGRTWRLVSPGAASAAGVAAPMTCEEAVAAGVHES